MSKDRLRLWVDRYLITPGRTRGTVYRGPESTGREEWAIPNAAVDVLEERHLIRAEARAGGERWYELTHDRFVGPIKDSNGVWKEQYERRRRQRKLLSGVGASVGVTLVGILFYATWTYFAEYQRTDGAIERLLTLNMSDPETARRKAPAALGDVADYLWQKDKLDHLAELLKRAAPMITEQYRMDRRMGDVMPQVADDARWPIELRYHPDRYVDTGRLLYEWRITAARLMDTRGIPVPAALKLTQDRNVPVDGLVVIADELKTSIEAFTLRGGFVLVSENKMPKRLQAWFDTFKMQWACVDVLKDGGPWWLVPRWTQPLFEAASHPPSPREAVIALAVEQRLTAQPELALNPKNVAYLLRHLEGAGFKHTVAEALASRGGIDGLVEDLCALVARGYPLVNLEYVLDSLAAYPRAQFSSAVVAEHVEKDQTTATLRGGVRFVGARGAAAEAAGSAPAEDIVPYRDTASRIARQPSLRVYLGDELLEYLVPRESKFLEELEDRRGELFKRFGIVVPPVKFRASKSDPGGNLPPNAFRVEVLTQTWADKDAIAVKVAIPEGAAEQVLLDELRRRLLAWRTWWITADYVDKQLERDEPLKTWLLNRYAMTDIKSLLRGVLAPSDRELDAYRTEGAGSALRQAAPGQSLREFDWLLGSLVFWSQASDGLDTAQLVRALQDTQAARLAPDRPSSPDNPATGILAGIEALEQADFPLAEERFREAVAADRSGAVATFLAAYASRDSVSTMGELNKLTQACAPFEPPGSLNERRSINEQPASRSKTSSPAIRARSQTPTGRASSIACSNTMPPPTIAAACAPASIYSRHRGTAASSSRTRNTPWATGLSS